VSGLLFTAQGPQYDILYGGGDADIPKVNIGDMQNTGVDVSATYHGSVAKDFKFDVGLTFTSYSNKIVDIPGLAYYDEGPIWNNILQREQEGQPFGSFFGYEVIGLFQSPDDVAKSPTQTDAQPGVFKYKDVTGDGNINDSDRTFIGNPNPDFEYGLNISLSYKNFDFSSFFFGSHGMISSITFYTLPISRALSQELSGKKQRLIHGRQPIPTQTYRSCEQPADSVLTSVDMPVLTLSVRVLISGLSKCRSVIPSREAC
jgi:hypothetical protein